MSYLILAVLLAVTQTPSPVPRQTSDSANQSTNKRERKANQHHDQIAPAPTQVTEKAMSEKAPPDNPASPNTQQPIRITELPPVSVTRDWMDKTGWAFGAILVGVGIVGVCAAYRTLRAIERQARIMRRQTAHIARQAVSMRRQTTILRDSVAVARESADAALLNAQAIIKSERPWIFVSIDSTSRFDIPKQANIYFMGKNGGRAPARVTRMCVVTYPHAQDAEFPAEPPYHKTELMYPKYVPPGEPFRIEDFNLRLEMTDEMWGEMNKRKERFLFIGHVVYFDLFMEQEHETRFCYFLSPNPGVGLVMTGPRHYNQHT